MAWILSAFVTCPMLLCCWFVGGSLLHCARDRIVRDEPVAWARAFDGGMDDGTSYRFIGPFCHCCCLAARLLGALTPPGAGVGHHYSVWLPLENPPPRAANSERGGAADDASPQIISV